MPPNSAAVQTREMEPLHLRAEFVPSTIDKEKRTVELTWSTGYKGRRSPYWGDDYFEELAMDAKSVRMQRLESGRAPFLAVHNGYTLDTVLGVVQRAWIENGVGRAVIKFSNRPEVESIFRDVCDGILSNVSVGYNVYKYQDVSESDDKLKTWRAVDWEPFEISLVPMGFDPDAAVRSAAPSGAQGQDRPVARHNCEFLLRADSASNTGDKTMPPEVNQGTAVRQDGSQGSGTPTPAPAGKTEAEIRSAERQRAKDIRSAVKLARLEDSIAETLIDEGKSLDEARAFIFDAMAKRDADQGKSTSTNRVEVTRDAADTLRRGCEDALLTRFDRKQFKPTDQGDQFRSFSLMDFARAFCEAQGISTRGLGKMEIAKRALHDTTDFPGLLANVANKTLRQAYDYAPKTYEPITRYTEAPDFKQIQRSQLGDSPTLVKVPEGGEITYGTIGEGKEVYQLATYARIIAITRQVIVNDDLNAFTRIPQGYGNAAAQLQSDLAWLQVTSNPTMGDSVALFHANHGNLLTAGAISVATIGLGRAAMRKQTGINGMKINPAAKYLIVPVELETTADQFVSTALLAQQSSNVNPFAGRLQVISEPRLSDVSTSNWFLGADPMQVDMLEMAFLQGQQGVYVETRVGFDVDGVEVKARLDVAAKVIDWRGFQKNPN
jgi:hypothetical protein